MEDRFDTARYVVRVRRMADLSQRELAARLGVDKSVVSRIETGRVVPTVAMLERILDVAGLRFVVVDARGRLVRPIAVDLVRDNAGRRYPAHLDVRAPDDIPARQRSYPRWDRPPVPAWFHHREERDRQRAGRGTIGDQPTVADLEQRRADLRRKMEERSRMRAAAIAVRQPPIPECCCHVDCYGSPGCVVECTCQCEPPASSLA